MKRVKMSIKNLIVAFIAALLVKMLIKEVTLGDAISITSLCATFCIESYLHSKQLPNLSEDVQKELEAMRSTLASIKVGNLLTKRQ